ncbi:glycosyltransferase family 25 protein [Lentithecium fluviatile CBS 122367]|uniref:Glycosyltransferase family 25 protein n=1 Tax=Lentithecium fluviatile CBS 122367 TaxID=1168545 RepID=A0A6G1J4H6_9PLEO|nr:glycosyltransferase family 25 protein [Lentithecium fluviatile CBS 122367]
MTVDQFGAITAVSHSRSPRIKGLLWAANLTGIDITIPEQPFWTEGDLETFRSGNKSQITKGSALAWLGHLNALRWFLSTSHETALIIEDDVDWNIALRKLQIQRAESAFSSVMFSPISSSPHARRRSDPNSWSSSRGWELLWLGHCGDKASPEHITSHPHLIYNDNTVPSKDHLDYVTSTFLNNLHVPEHSRMVHRSYWPLCTFAYAVTRASAQRILSTYGSEVATAYDVALLEACRDHDWSCYTITPELFHHIEAPSEIANVDAGAQENKEGLAVTKVPATHNIGCGARGQDMWVEVDDWRGRRWMVEMVRSGHCFVHGT